MIEADLEKKIVDKLNGLLEQNEIDGVQVTSSFQISEIKSIQQSGKTAYIVVKASPRSYASPTIPTTTIDCGISLTVRADIDYNGKNYLDLADMLMKQYEIWQKCEGEAHDDFTLDDFDITGFVLGNGTTTIDSGTVVFQYNHTFTVYGVVIDN